MHKSILSLLLMLAALTFSAARLSADDKKVDALLDKAIKALGGEQKLKSINAVLIKSKGTIVLGGGENPVTTTATVQGIDHSRQEFEGEFDGNPIKGFTILSGDKGYQEFAGMGQEMNDETLARTKRSLYMQLIPITLLPLKTKGFKVEAADETKVAGKAAVGVKVTGPDEKDFKLYFDKQSGLPVKTVAEMPGFMGELATQESVFSAYKDFDGVKKSTKTVVRRNGEKFLEAEITEFKVLSKVDPKTFVIP